MGRARLDMTPGELIAKMSDGNPGAITVLYQILQEAPVIDPVEALTGGIMKVLILDDIGIYGPNIWMLFKDVCNKDINKVILVLRAKQLGIIDKGDIDLAMGMVKPLNFGMIAKMVQKEIPEFVYFG